jgi:hypothetical protein
VDLLREDVVFFPKAFTSGEPHDWGIGAAVRNRALIDSALGVSYKRKMVRARASIAGRATSYAVALALLGSTAHGLFCDAGPQDEAAMECCKKDAPHCNQPEKRNDCCKPDRGANTPAALASAAGTVAKPQPENADIAALPSVLFAFSGAEPRAPVPSARGFPARIEDRPLETPLRI